ncbi:unnamed protein product [Cladocopium goreaui]|uniref:Uncharacterized protein n=1 Tax=Cladocopium goreaui TaxID=2562237 RepID=A0A9P1DAR3_9DINO|nr:unnamed protein product [Cladocopium goreaui]
MSLPWRPQWSSDHAALAPDDSLFQEALKKMRAGGAPGTAADLSPASGVLDFKPVEGYADNLANAVKKAVQDCGNSCLVGWLWFVHASPPVASQQDVEANIKKTTRVFVTDSAAAELLVSNLLSAAPSLIMRKAVLWRRISQHSKLSRETRLTRQRVF